MDDGLLWLAGVNLVLWTGLFLYMLRVERRIRREEER